MAAVFISYRTDDSPYVARIIYDKLERRLGDAVFLDKPRLRPGETWLDRIRRELSDCRVLLTIIGRNWKKTLDEKYRNAPPHVQDSTDLWEDFDVLQFEIYSALNHSRIVMPILVDDLPGIPNGRVPIIKELRKLQTTSVNPGESFTSELDRLVAEVLESIGRTDAPDIEMVRLHAGAFRMGDPSCDRPDSDRGPVHEMRIINEFRLCRYPITQDQYMCVLGNLNPDNHNPSEFSGDGAERWPVENVSWFDAIRFCNEYSRQRQLPPYYTIKGATVVPDLTTSVEIKDIQAPGYRLPTEAEWEYACRAGTTTRFSFGNDESELCHYAHFGDEAPREVGSYLPNEFELYDMYGNVMEWCWDRYFTHQYRKNADLGARVYEEPAMRIGRPQDRHVVRGGGYDDDQDALGSAVRYFLPGTTQQANVGFRIAQNCHC